MSPTVRNVFILVGIVVVAFIAWQIIYPTYVISKTRQAIVEAGSCTEDADCVVVSSGVCELGCYFDINKKEMEQILRQADKAARYSDSDCALSCMAPGTPRCEAGRCTSQ